MTKPFSCEACGQQFAGLVYFDKHRTGKFTEEHPSYGRKCLSPAEMREIGLELNAKNQWHDPALAEKMKNLFTKDV